MAAAKKLSQETKSGVFEALTLVIEEARQEFEAEKAEASAAWKKELARQKEEDLYQFNKEKRDREDDLKQNLDAAKQAMAAKMDELESRLTAVDGKEEYVVELEAKVADFPKQLSTAESTGYYKGHSDSKREYEAEARIKDAETAADKKVLEARISNLNETVELQDIVISKLQDELKAANSRVETIATNAVQAAGQSKVTVQAGANSK